MLHILLVKLLLTVISTGIQLYNAYHNDLESLDERISNISEIHLKALNLSIWTVDAKQIEAQLEGLLRISEVAAATLETSFGEKYAVGPPPSEFFKSYQVTLFSEDQQNKLGELVIYADLEQISKQSQGRMFVSLITEAIKNLVAAFAILLIVQLLITRHLKRISDYTHSLGFNSLHMPLKLERESHDYKDELDTFVNAINKMRQRFRTDLNLLQNIQRNLEASEEKFRLAMQATQDGLWDWDIVTNTVYFSPNWGKILEFEEPLPETYSTWFERIHPDDQQRVMDSLDHHLEGKTDSWQEEHRLKNAEDKWVWVLGRGQVVKRDEDGKPLRMIGTMIDIHLKKMNERLIWRQANFDRLTDLPNRNFTLEMLQQNINRADRNKQQIWLCFLDLDGFKEVNDTYGHQAGDHLLQLVAERLKENIRQSDVAGRFAGDEFVLILADTNDIARIDDFARRLIEHLAEPYELSNQQVNISASVGIANYPNDTSDPEELLKQADHAMYAAKNEGKNRYTYYTPALQNASLVRQQISKDLREAIKLNQFELYYQPIIERDKNLHKAEVLIRWNHPEKGIISPAAFIPIAEETGDIFEIETWVFQNAMDQLKDWKQRYDCEAFKLSINLSPLHLQSQDTHHQNWFEMIQETAMERKDIILEITEGLLLKNNALIDQRLAEFHDAGIEIAVDDFGTGYSSLAYLRELDVDYLKIDQSFIRTLAKNSDEETLVRAIIDMAHGLNLKVIAEGVETEEQQTILNNMQCDYLQGYLFSKPLPAETFVKQWLTSS